MAVIHVNSWDSFLTAVNTAGATVILDADIDASNDIRTSKIEVKALEVDGQNHTLYNITSTHNGDDFNCDYYYNGSYIEPLFKNINFYNIASTGTGRNNSFFYASHGHFYVRNCRFQGIINKAFIVKTDLIQCSCSFERLGYLGGSDSSNHILECWIDIGNCVLNETADNFYYGNIEYSYFKGSLDTNKLRDNYPIFRSDILSSIINIELSDSSTNPKTVKMCSNDATNICLFNNDKINFSADTVFTIQNNFTGLTDANLKNPTAVSATGFTPFVS